MKKQRKLLEFIFVEHFENKVRLKVFDVDEARNIIVRRGQEAIQQHFHVCGNLDRTLHRGQARSSSPRARAFLDELEEQP